eukprot:9794623-Prorocentrum_lima.AAC.2
MHRQRRSLAFLWEGAPNPFVKASAELSCDAIYWALRRFALTRSCMQWALIDMKRVLNAECGPDLTMYNVAELSFRTLATGVLRDKFNFGYPRPYPPILLHMNICFPDRQDIRLGPWHVVTPS